MCAIHSLAKSDLSDIALETLHRFSVTEGDWFISQVRFTCYQVLGLGSSGEGCLEWSWLLIKNERLKEVLKKKKIKEVLD